MNFYIAHCEADQAHADELKAFLKNHGVPVEAEDGSRTFHHLQASDVVIALWSQKAVFGNHRMMFEKRMLDAWADGQLVLVKLDHGVLPVGLRDLPAIDASIHSGRELQVWPTVERKAREVMNDALVAREEAAPRERVGTGSGGLGGGVTKKIEIDDNVVSLPRRRVGFPWMVVLLALALAGLGYSGWRVAGVDWDFALAPIWARSLFVISGLVAIVILVRALFSGGKTKRAKPAEDYEPPMPARMSNRKRSAPEAAAEPAPPPAPQPAPAALFISYAHADNAAVEPVVAFVTATGRTVWIDKTGIEAGEGWAGEIVRAIKGAKGIIVMCSKHAFESDHVKREVYLADRYKKPMRPVFLEAAQPPEDFEYFFASVQWLELWKLPEADRAAAIGKALEAV